MAETCNFTCVGLAVMGVSVVYFLYRKLSNKQKKEWPKDTVVLHQIGRGPWAPSLSPFPTKLETYLRMAKIPYVNDHKGGMSSKGKTPWISYNGEDVADSQLSIEYLSKKLDIDLDSHLTNEERAVATAFRILTDEHLYWILVLWRWVYDKKDFLYKAFSPFIPWFMPTRLLMAIGARTVRKQVHAQGLGRHTYEEFLSIGENDLKTLSDQIGKKKYLMGDRPCQADCSVFAMLVQLIYQSPTSPHRKILTESYGNLVDYTTRMKDEFWPDWDECITHDYTREATK